MNVLVLHDAELREWDYTPPVLGIHNGFYTGYVYNDSKGRFPDDSRIRTSSVVSVEGDILRTLNTTYKLGAPNEH
tara:strand:- start:2092 stop:2316 length:225 start_codon:yes stop_codon:yes gene_type:complete